MGSDLRQTPRSVAASARPWQETARAVKHQRVSVMAPPRVSRRIIFAVPLLTTSGLAERARAALEGDFYAFLSAVRRDAAAQGVRTSTIERALRNAEFLLHVIELDRKQPERQLTFGEYLESRYSPNVSCRSGCLRSSSMTCNRNSALRSARSIVDVRTPCAAASRRTAERNA